MFITLLIICGQPVNCFLITFPLQGMKKVVLTTSTDNFRDFNVVFERENP